MTISFIGFVLGIILGSFTKALADRSLQNKSFLGRSFCPSCKKTLNWYDLIPIFSYVTLLGKCRYCKHKIGSDYLFSEVVMGLLISFLFSIYPLTTPLVLADLLFKTFFITILAALFITDLKQMLIPDRIIIPSIYIALAYLVGVSFLTGSYQSLFLSLEMAGLIGGFFWGLIIITSGKGMGGGDVKLGFFLGLALGFPNALLATMLAFLMGSIVALALILLGKKHFGQLIPFGPFLVMGSLISLFWGQLILKWYLDIPFK